MSYQENQPQMPFEIRRPERIIFRRMHVIKVVDVTGDAVISETRIYFPTRVKIYIEIENKGTGFRSYDQTDRTLF